MPDSRSPFPPRQSAGDPRGLRTIRCPLFASSIFSPGLSWRLTAGASRPVRPCTRTLRWPRLLKCIEQVEVLRALPGSAPRTCQKVQGNPYQGEDRKACGQMQLLKKRWKGRSQEAPDKSSFLTDLDARSMATSGKGTGIVGYNVQIAVDTEHHLIVAHEVDQFGTDRSQLAAMGGKAREATGCEEVTAGGSRLLQRRRGAGLRGEPACSPPLRSQDADLRQRQARPLHGAGFHLRRCERPHGGRVSDARGRYAETAGTIWDRLPQSRHA